MTIWELAGTLIVYGMILYLILYIFGNITSKLNKKQDASASSKFNMGAGVVSILFGVVMGFITICISIDMLIHYEFGTMNVIFCVVPLMFIWIGWYIIKKELQSNKVGDTIPCQCSPH